MSAATPSPEHAEAARLTRAGRFDDAVRLYARLLGARDDHHAQRLEMFEAIAATIRGGGVPPRPPPPRRVGARPFVSVVICSIDDAKWRAATAMYERLLDGWPHEIIGFHDARSLSEAYNRGIARARGDIVAFSHDDVTFLTDDVFDRLSIHLDTVDMVVVVGNGHQDFHGAPFCP
ncbi:MAG: hypothetical protein HQL40_12425, partial [Alphaproteobacteria bacterium]|nr:hypothetical protein [Alphaproteobacteria bacterium]